MTAFPDWIEPMAATLTYERFEGPAWLFERKIDGIRLLAFKKGDKVELFSRNRLPQDLPAVAAAIAALPVNDAILDGELTWEGSAYHVFDIMWLDGREVMSLPLVERRGLLARLPMQAPLTRVAVVTDAKPWDRACREGWEGVIAKRRESVYEQRRSIHWQKMKCEASQELVIGGYTDPEGARVGLGALEIPHPPFTKGVGLPRQGAHWARPEVVAQIGFISWTRHGKLRHPRFIGLREDKAAREVVRERP
jgi:ATP-dependent DNA ligase